MLSQLYETASDHTPKPLKELVRTAATRLGCAIGRLPGIEVLAPRLRELFATARIDYVLDVGAHLGGYGRFLRNIGYRGWIISFEPVPENYRVLAAATRNDSKWRALPFALGDREVTTAFNVAHTSQFSSFLEPNSYSIEQFGVASETERVIDVEMRQLDSMLEEIVGESPDHRLFLKMDTQGYDMNVLDGARSSLRIVHGIQTEVSVKAIYQHMTPYDVAIERLQSLGFELTGLFPVTRDRDLRIVEFDCVMRRFGFPNDSQS